MANDFSADGGSHLDMADRLEQAPPCSNRYPNHAQHRTGQSRDECFEIGRFKDGLHRYGCASTSIQFACCAGWMAVFIRVGIYTSACPDSCLGGPLDDPLFPRVRVVFSRSNWNQFGTTGLLRTQPRLIEFHHPAEMKSRRRSLVCNGLVCPICTGWGDCITTHVLSSAVLY